MFEFLGPLLGAGANLLGGILGSNSAAAQRDQNREIAQMNIDMQREFAQHGIRWKAADARAAGIHPVFGMGAQGASFSPVSVANVEDPMPAAMGRMGQDISRAVTAGLTMSERREQMEMKKLSDALTLNNMGLQNEMLKTQIQKMQMGPPMPTAGQRSPGGGSSGDVIVSPTTGEYEKKPMEVTTAVPFDPGHAAGRPGPQVTWAVGPGGGLQPFPAKGLIEDQELTNPLMLRWMLTQGHYRPTMAQMKEIHPTATGMRLDLSQLAWVPTFGQGRSTNQDFWYDRVRTMSSHSGARGTPHPFSRYPRGGSTVTVPMPR